MKRYLILILLLSLLNGENNKTVEPKDTNETIKEKKSLIVDLDKEHKNTTRGDSKKGVIEGSLFLGDNDEVAFKGDILLKKAPVTVTYNDNDEVALKGNSFTIKTMELKANSHIIMRDKNGTVFVDQVVRKF